MRILCAFQMHFFSGFAAIDQRIEDNAIGDNAISDNAISAVFHFWEPSSCPDPRAAGPILRPEIKLTTPLSVLSGRTR
jgi:hypothetical protein